MCKEFPRLRVTVTASYGFPIVDCRRIISLRFTEQDFIDDPDLENKINRLIEELSHEDSETHR